MELICISSDEVLCVWIDDNCGNEVIWSPLMLEGQLSDFSMHLFTPNNLDRITGCIGHD